MIVLKHFCSVLLITYVLLSGSNVFAQGVGIGVGIPAGLLHVSQSGTYTFPEVRVTQEVNGEYTRIRLDNANVADVFWDIAASVSVDPLTSRLILFNPQQGNILTIRGNGNVGISAISPHEMLEIGYTGRVFIGDGEGAARSGLLIDANEPDEYVRLHPFNYGTGTDMVLGIATPVSIGYGNLIPDSSVIFQIHSTERGILIPRMTLAQREAIDSPEESLMVYQTDSTSGYWYFSNGLWRSIGNNTFLADRDNDTKIQVEESVDDDIIRFDLGGAQRWIMTGRRLAPTNGDASVFIGMNAGLNNELTYTGNVFIGNQAGEFNTSGFSNIAIGDGSLRKNTIGSACVAVGTYALNNNGVGASESFHSNSNTAIGYFALTDNTTGYINTACGYGALNHNTTGVNNVAIGGNALADNTIGTFNVAVGASALENNTTGWNNTSVGHYALNVSTSGNANTAIGAEALRYNTTGYVNTATGGRALFQNTTGHHNTAFGDSSLYSNITASYNTAHGAQALFSNTTGDQNTAIGNNALYLNSTGNLNTACGYMADVASGSLTHATAIGANAVVGQSYAVVLGDPDRTIKVGIGTSTPTDLLTITGNDPRFFIGDTTSTARRGLLIDGVEPGDYVRIHAYDYDPGTNLDINIPSDLLVGVWGGTTSYTLELAGTSGTAAKPGGGTWTSTSDRRLKQNIHDYSDGLAEIMQVHPVRYHYTAETGYNTETEYVGIIAQEIQEVAPYMVSTFEKNQEAYLAVDASALTYMLVNAVKEQQAVIMQQQEAIADLQRSVSLLQELVSVNGTLAPPDK